MNDNLEIIGQEVDRIDNLISALSIPMPAEMHIEQLKSILPEISAKIKEALFAETGENPWE